jgi:4-carboxymuconolactone decarboxylase
MSESIQQTAAQKAFGDVSPKLASLSDEVLFGDVWERSGLSKRDRSLATIATLITLRASDQLRHHIAFGIANGLRKDEISELITHMAFYAGWPAAAEAITVARAAFAETGNK